MDDISRREREGSWFDFGWESRKKCLGKGCSMVGIILFVMEILHSLCFLLTDDYALCFLLTDDDVLPQSVFHPSSL